MRRQCLYDDTICTCTMTLFSTEDVVMEDPFRVRFEGERGVDTGGLGREAF